MWPLWLIIACAAGGAVTLTVSGVLLAVWVERKRHRKLTGQHNLDRNVSQLHRPHLSINDVDFAALPRPARSLRQSIVSPRRDSRFYSAMPSEDKIRTFPDGSADCVAEASFVHTGTDAERSHQWLSPSWSGRKEKRKKKAPTFSISVPMARSPLSAVTEVNESERAGSPDPVELPTHITPRVTPEKPIDHQNNAMPTYASHSSMNTIMNHTGRNTEQLSQLVSHSHIIKPSSISMGSVNAPPPDFPLPPVPENMLKQQLGDSSQAWIKLELSADHRGISLLNTQISPQEEGTYTPLRPSKSQLRASDVLSGFDLGLEDGMIQVIRVEPEQESRATRADIVLPQRPRSTKVAPVNCPPEESFKTTDGSKWSAPQGPWHLGSSTLNLSETNCEAGIGPVSDISLTGYNSLNGSITLDCNGSKLSFDPPSRPVSISSVDIFRNSIVGSNVSVLAPESPRSRGHKRQNCVRISGLTPVDTTKKKLSSQLRRLSEAEEADPEDTKSVSVKFTTTSPTRYASLAAGLPVSCADLNVQEIKQPQALSLRVKRPGACSVRTNQSRWPPPVDIGTSSVRQQPVLPMQKPPQGYLTRSRTTEPRFVYQGSPASDPTKPPQPKQEYSPVSPAPLALTPEKQQSHPQVTYSPAPLSMLNSPTTSTISPRRNKTQLHGPRNIPPQSLRARNRTGSCPRQSERSGSPIRKISINNTQKQRSTSQDDIKRSLALLTRLTHAAQSSSGLPEVNIVRSNSVDGHRCTVSRTPSSRYADDPAIAAPAQRLRQRAKTVGKGAAPGMFDSSEFRPKTRLPPPPPQQQQQWKDMSPAGSRFPYSPSDISIWEDASVKGNSPGISTKLTPQSIPRNSQTDTAGKILADTTNSDQPLEKESLWKLQQNADLITTRALALGGSSPKMLGVSSLKDRKVSKLVDGCWGSQSQVSTSDDLAKIRENISQVSQHPTSRKRSEGTISNVRNGWANAAATGYGTPGPRSRQRSHTVAVNNCLTNRMDIRTKEGVGLGLEFGRTGLGTTFLNDMERDRIGRLR